VSALAHSLLTNLRRSHDGGERGSGFETSRFLARWLALGTVIGIVAGLGAVLFIHAITWVTHIALGVVVGYLPPFPVGEGDPTRHHMDRPWLLPLVTGLGGLLSGIIVYNLAPEAEGHGTDAAIAAIHHKRGMVRGRIAPIKLVASALTIGTGGSGGREGPAAQISAGFGSLLGQWLKLGTNERRIAVAAGMGAGIGAIFRAPLGGAVMATEILYIHDLEIEALIPGLIASIVGYSVFGAIEGWEPIFGAQPGIGFERPLTLIYYAALGIACGAVGLLYCKTFYGVEALFHRLAAPKWLKPALGGVMVGLIGLVVRGAIHTGYGWVQIGMTAELLTLPLWLVLVLPFAKILATSFSIGSGGSGGIFGPGMVIGGLLGAAFWRIGHGWAPQLPSTPAPFVIVGMMALFGGVAHAPLAVMLMVAEMTGNLSLLAPAMVAVALSTALVGDETIYRSQLPDRAHSPAHRMRFSFPLLSSLLVRDAMRPPSGTEPPGGDHLPRVDPEDSLDNALEVIAESGLSAVPVVDSGGVRGSLSARDVIATYRAALGRSVRRTRSLPAASGLLEIRLPADSALVGKSLGETRFPPDTLIVSIVRDGEALFPNAAARLEAGDVVGALTTRQREEQLRQFLAGDSGRSL
jgi:CIC family chloride channel protein